MNRRRGLRPIAAAWALGFGLIGDAGLAQSPAPTPPPAPAVAKPARQVTLFGVMATPGTTGVADPKLSAVLPQLRRLLPHHKFRLVEIASDRAVAGQTVRCDLGDGFVATSEMVAAQDSNGRVQMRFRLAKGKESLYQTLLVTPPDQVFFCENPLPDGSKLLVGLGAR